MNEAPVVPIPNEITLPEPGCILVETFPVTPGGGHGKPLQFLCLENPPGQRSLAGWSPWGCKELDTTEQLTPTHPQEGLPGGASGKEPTYQQHK